MPLCEEGITVDCVPTEGEDPLVASTTPRQTDRLTPVVAADGADLDYVDGDGVVGGLRAVPVSVLAAVTHEGAHPGERLDRDLLLVTRGQEDGDEKVDVKPGEPWLRHL